MGEFVVFCEFAQIYLYMILFFRRAARTPAPEENELTEHPRVPEHIEGGHRHGGGRDGHGPVGEGADDAL